MVYVLLCALYTHNVLINFLLNTPMSRLQCMQSLQTKGSLDHKNSV